MENVTLTQKEQTRLQVLNSFLTEHITLDQAAELMGVSPRHTRRMLAAYQESGAAALKAQVWLPAFLPSGLPAVRAGPPDHPAPFHPALGGDFAAAVKAMTAVVVVILNVLGHQLQAVGAAGHPSGVVRRVVPFRSLVHQGRNTTQCKVLDLSSLVALGAQPVAIWRVITC